MILNSASEARNTETFSLIIFILSVLTFLCNSAVATCSFLLTFLGDPAAAFPLFCCSIYGRCVTPVTREFLSVRNVGSHLKVKPRSISLMKHFFLFYFFLFYFIRYDFVVWWWGINLHCKVCVRWYLNSLNMYLEWHISFMSSTADTLVTDSKIGVSLVYSV